MSVMFNLAHVLEFIVHGLDDRPFSQHNLVMHCHQAVFHVVTYPCNQLYPIREKYFAEFIRDISHIIKKLSEYFFQEIL
jgi:hypothetical protein